MKTETLKEIEQADAAVESARRRYDSAKERTRAGDALENFLDDQGDRDAPEEIAAAAQELAKALRAVILIRRDAHPEFLQFDADNAADHEAKIRAVDKEEADETEAITKGVRILGFAESIDAPRPVSIRGSFAPAVPTLWEQILAGNSHVKALKARRQSLLSSPPTPQAPGNAAESKLLEKRLRELLNPNPKVMRRVAGFPLVFIDRAEPDHEAARQWPEWELRQASVPVTQ